MQRRLDCLDCFLAAVKTFLWSKGSDYKSGDIRLVGGRYSWEGRVEIYLNGEWLGIGTDCVDALDARVVCTQLGFDTRCEFLL